MYNIKAEQEYYIAEKEATHSRNVVPKPKLASLMACVARFLAAYPRSFRSEPISSLDSRSVFILMKLAFPINQSNNLLMFYCTNARERYIKNKGRDLRVRDIEEEPGTQWAFFGAKP